MGTAARIAIGSLSRVFLYPSSFRLGELAELLRGTTEMREFDPAGGPLDLSKIGVDTAAVIIVDAVTQSGMGSRLGDALAASGNNFAAIALSDDPRDVPERGLFLVLPASLTRRALANAVERAFEYLHQRMANQRMVDALARQSSALAELNRVGIALSAERDYERLLSLIVAKARAIANCDAGSLYLVEEGAGGTKQLRFKLSQNDSVDVPYTEFTLPLSKKSLAGYVAVTGDALMIADAYELPPHAEYSFNRSFDEKMGYRSKSQLVVPMTDHLGEIIGVIQLINRKRSPGTKLSGPESVEREVIGFDGKIGDLVRSLASQAAVSIENNRLYESIERLFEGFVFASVTAIEQRDPTTSGHSSRVATLTCGLAELVDRAGEGDYRDVRFSRDQMKEIRYASILHDFGKIGVREQVLVKAKKLYEGDLERIRARFEIIRRSTELATARKKVAYLLEMGRRDHSEAFALIDQQLAGELAEIDLMVQKIIESNEPTVLPAGNFEYILKIAQNTYEDSTGRKRSYLLEDEVKILSLRKGSLNERERIEIESHVSHTYRFLSKIPWTSELKRIPQYAYSHHEKLNGRGYPNNLTQLEIPIQSRMMTVADIFDALSASDRPYKRAVPTEKAVDILRAEAKDGLIEAGLVDLFVAGKIYDLTRS